MEITMIICNIKKKLSGDIDTWFAWYPVFVYKDTRTIQLIWLSKLNREWVANGYELGYSYTKIT